jgi:DNA invertase Pin-like site-specific DNA recombinase
MRGFFRELKMNIAIYPRKSKKDDNSESMEQQIDDCKKYINKTYHNANIIVYSGDYAITGHSTAKRKDFQRMMDDVRAGRINAVVIMRYDRIARNMRDFCNLYHDMESAGCNLISVSQQIDTSTPYGKNFMYQMANMAELEWAVISERYKDTAAYKIREGKAYTGRVPIGFKIEKIDGVKKVVHDNEEQTRAIFDYLLATKSKRGTVLWVRENLISDFTRHKLDSMINSDLYIGKVRENENFCEPYFTKEQMEEIRSVNQIKYAPSGHIYLFSGLFRCPICGRKMASFYSIDRKTKKHRQYQRCWFGGNEKLHKTKLVSEAKTEKYLLENLDAALKNRGVKTNKKLYVLRKTKAPAMLIECCFVDDKDDVALYDYKSMASAIVYGITGQQYIEPSNNTSDDDAATSGSETSVGDKDSIYRVQVGAYRNKANAISLQEKLKSAGFDAAIVKA